MKGHERPLTFLKYNRDGDLLFSCAKDHTPTVWFADNGERLGTYRGHNGAVWSCDVSSKYLLLFFIYCIVLTFKIEVPIFNYFVHIFRGFDGAYYGKC